MTPVALYNVRRRLVVDSEVHILGTLVGQSLEVQLAELEVEMSVRVVQGWETKVHLYLLT